MGARSRASAHWEGSTADGRGHVSAESGAVHQHPLLWSARVGEQPGTTPEELIAAAWAGCFCMEFSGRLTREGQAPASLDVDAELAFVARADDGGFEIGKGRLVVDVEIEGIDARRVEQVAEQAKLGCPVSIALGSIAEEAKIEVRVHASAAH